MKKIFQVLFLVFLAGTAFATPSTTYWTPDVMDIQAYKVVHIGIDNYSITTRPSSHNPQDGPTAFVPRTTNSRWVCFLGKSSRRRSAWTRSTRAKTRIRLMPK